MTTKTSHGCNDKFELSEGDIFYKKRLHVLMNSNHQILFKVLTFYDYVKKFNSNSTIAFSMIILFSMALMPYLTQDAFAASPIVSAVANDPDDGDRVYSVGDTIIITFPGDTNATSGGTMTNAEFRLNFTVSNSDIDVDDTVSGVWTSQSILTITIDAIADALSLDPVIDTDEVNYDVSGGTLFYELNDTAGGAGTEFTGTAVTLTGDFGLFLAAILSGGGSSCSGDCTEPTLGFNNEGRKLVDDGFSYNGKSVDVEYYFTPYPLVTVNVGKQNVAEFKIYDNLGPDNISHFELAFGLASGESIGMSKAVINWDKSFDGIETITLDDPENVLDKIKITTSEGYCKDDSEAKCLVVKVVHTFRAPLDFNILGTNVWDVKRNAWQNYYNHGVEVIGESLNPPKIYDGINKGHIYHLTETGKNIAVDEFGNAWTLDKTWTKDYVKPERIVDSDTSTFTRMHSEFAKYKDSQANDALEQLLALYPERLMRYVDFKEPFSYEFPETIDRIIDPELQKNLRIESEKAQKIMEHLLDPSLYRYQ